MPFISKASGPAPNPPLSAMRLLARKFVRSGIDHVHQVDPDAADEHRRFDPERQPAGISRYPQSRVVHFVIDLALAQVGYRGDDSEAVEFAQGRADTLTLDDPELEDVPRGSAKGVEAQRLAGNQRLRQRHNRA